MMKEDKISGKSQVTATIELHSDPTDGGFKLAVKLDVGIEGQDDATTQDLAKRAHAYCPYSKATSGNIDVSVNAVAYEADK